MAEQRDGSVVEATPRGGLVPTIRQALVIAAGHLQAGDHQRARTGLEQILKTEPGCAEAWFYLGLIHQSRNDAPTAIAHYEEALRLDPDLAEGRNNLGVLLQERGDFAEAEGMFREAIRLEEFYAEAYNNLGNVLQDQGRFEEAVMAYRRALAIRPRYVEALKHLGNALRALGRLADAIACYDAGLEISPDHVLLHTARAMVWVQMGDLTRGFAECEWRLRGQDLPIHHLDKPEWDGQPLDGRTLLVATEQGLGDTIQFIRFARESARRGAHVVVACAPILARILSTCPGVDAVVSSGTGLPEFDCYAPVMSLARILGTTLETIPSEVPYLFADPERVSAWKQELDGIDGLKIGVVWQGNPIHTRDRERSFRLEQIEPLARVPGVRLFSLQKNHGLEQLDAVKGRFTMTPLGHRLHDFVDTAAVMENLDLVVTADSSPAHLAGALGVPVWTMLPSVCDWRWMSDRDDTPWYPTMHLFRQRRFGDWDEVFQRLAARLRHDYGLNKAG